MALALRSDQIRHPLDPTEIAYALSRIDGAGGDGMASRKLVSASVPDCEARFRADPACAAWLESHYESPGDGFVWDQRWRDIPATLLARVFTTEELLRLWHGETIMSELCAWVDAEHEVLRKIVYSHWHYGGGWSWNRLVDHLEGLPRLRIDLPDFSIRLTHTRTINEFGYAAHDVHPTRGLYLDGEFGLLLYYRGEHVLTTGFSLSDEGILVAQAQLREKKGNRFLFRLPGHHLDVMLGVLAKAFPTEKIWLVAGKSATAATRRAYGTLPCPMTTEDELRIQALYDRPLAAFRRARKTTEYRGRRFILLTPRVAPRVES